MTENARAPADRRLLRIGGVIHSLDGGGAERVLAGLLSRLAERGHHVTLITLDDGRRSRHEVSPSVARRPLDVLSHPNHRVSFAKRTLTLRRAIQASQFDVVMSFCDSNNVLTMIATIGLTTPVVLSERSDPRHQSLGKLKEFLRRRLYRRAKTVVALSDEVADYLKKASCCRTIVIPSAVDPPPPGWHRQTSSSESFTWIAVGRLEPEKGFDRLIRVLASLPVDGPPWRLRLVGEGSQRELLQGLIDDLGLHDQIKLTGWVSPVWQPLATADAFVLPSRYEGFPSALLEAMSAGLPVLSVDTGGGVRDAIRHAENGWLVANDDEKLRAGLMELMTDAALRSRLAAAAVEAATRFGWTTMVDAYEQCLLAATSAVPSSVDLGTMGSTVARRPDSPRGTGQGSLPQSEQEIR